MLPGENYNRFLCACGIIRLGLRSMPTVVLHNIHCTDFATAELFTQVLRTRASPGFTVGDIVSYSSLQHTTCV